MSNIKSSDFLQAGSASSQPVTQCIPFTVGDWVPNGATSYSITYTTSDFTIAGTPATIQVYCDSTGLTTVDSSIVTDSIVLEVSAIPDARFDGFVNITFK